jgi:transposase
MFNRETFMDHYHRRPNAESVLSMMKRKSGDSARSRCDVGQINEVLTKVLCHNMCVLIRASHELGVEATFGVGSRIEPELFI